MKNIKLKNIETYYMLKLYLYKIENQFNIQFTMKHDLSIAVFKKNCSLLVNK